MELKDLDSMFEACRRRKELAENIAALNELQPENFISDKTFKKQYYDKHASSFISALFIVSGFLLTAVIFLHAFRYVQNGFVAFGYMLSSIVCALAFRGIYIFIFNIRNANALDEYKKLKNEALNHKEENRKKLREKQSEFDALEMQMRENCPVKEELWDAAWLLEEFLSDGRAATLNEAIEMLSYEQRYVQGNIPNCRMIAKKMRS